MMYVYLGDGNTGDAPYAYLKYVEINLQLLITDWLMCI